MQQRSYVPFAYALQEFDAISLHCPPTENTGSLAATNEFEQM